MSKFDKFVLITTAAAALFIFAFVKIEPLLNPPPVEVATLTDQAGAQWGQLESGETLRAGSRLRSHGDPFWLQKGTAKVKFDYGAEVIIEGPAEFELMDEEKMILNSGRLYATVPKGAVGFTAVTPSATIIDLGTEFGVEVGFDGATDVHMFDGKASLVSGKAGRKAEAIDLLAGIAKRVNMQGQVRNIILKEKSFARKMDSHTGLLWRGEALDLADIVGGGDGFGSGLMGCGIDGNSGDLFTYNELRNQDWTVKDGSVITGKDSYMSNGRYNPVLSNPYIDGVFVPDGGDGLCVVSSDDHVFENCPDTGDDYHVGVINSGELLENKSARPGVSLYGLHPMKLCGQSYGTRQNPGLFLHANMGITFDLDAVRSALPGIKVAGFSSRYGLGDDDMFPTGKADFWVLVDGVKRFEARGRTRSAGAGQIEIPLEAEDRFLTIVTTDGGDSIGRDWCLFGRPTIVLEAE